MTNKIAAGEVVERPASVAKELLENSIDAGADKIEIEFVGGGVNKIEVKDNGGGISTEDLPRTIQRHTTSKITSAGDLEGVSTLGFRGEALASIASVAKVEIVSRIESEVEAHRLIKEPNKAPEVKPAARQPGTTVIVRDLFETVPARRKFLASEATEKKHILQTVQEKILAHPKIHFILRSANKEILNVPPGELNERVAATLGRETMADLLSLDRLEPEWKGLGRFGLTGLISNGEAVYHTRRHQFLFVNSRPVREPVFYRALSQAYQDLVLTDRHPVAVLFLNVPRSEIDVNVHPQKEEIRFNDSQAVFRFLYDSIRDTLEDYYQEEAESEIPGADPDRSDRSGHTGSGLASKSYTGEGKKEPDQAGLFKANEAEETGPTDRIIGQFKRTFLLVEREHGLLFVDQHNAHEKILFERYLEKTKQTDPAQYLSVPITMDVSPADREILKDNLEELRRLGLEIESFGGGSLVVQAVPGYLGRRTEDKKVIFGMLEEFLEGARAGETSEVDRDMLAIMACRSAIKRGEVLMPREQQELVEGLNGLEFPKLCPHGRPVYYELENETVANWVGRPLSDLEPR